MPHRPHGPTRVALIVVLLSFAHVLSAVASAPRRAADIDGAQQRAAVVRSNRAYPHLDSRLNQLVAASAESAVDQPQTHADKVAVEVSVRDEASRSTVIAFLAQHASSVARIDDTTLQATVQRSALVDLGAVSGVQSVRTMPPPVAHVEAQGAATMGTPDWNVAGYTGAGVKVGVIDVGFVGLDALQGVELPGEIVPHCFVSIGAPSDQLSDCETRQKHGTAVAEALIDVAPGVSLYIANPQSTFDLNETVSWMISQGVTVINHSVGWGFEGPGDGTSRFSDSALAAVNKAVAAGITWINSAGNEGASTWTGPFVDANADGVAEFAANAPGNSVSLLAGGTSIVQLRWDDAWGSAANDLDLFLYDKYGNVIESSTDLQDGEAGQDPYEWFSFTAPASGAFMIEVTLASGAAPDWFEVQAFTGEALQYHVSAQSIANPAESANPGLLAVGAAYWNTPTTIEPYSSQGPTRDGRVKPDLVASDGGSSASLGAFYGTSQSAPLVAGLAALIKQRWGIWSPQQINGYILEQAEPVDGPPNNIWGYGEAQAPPIGANPNPLPNISGVNPAQLTVGAPTALIVIGSDFLPTSVVYWNGVALETIYLSSTQLSIQLTTEQVSAVGLVGLYVLNPEPGGGASNRITIAVAPPGVLTFASPSFESTWQRTDEPVAAGADSRTWMWGPAPFSVGLYEEYAEGANQQRLVQYYDKSRMEITTDPNVTTDSIWYVTNGLLSKELITGQLQRGDNAFTSLTPAAVNVAGDPDDVSGPTYATFTNLLDAPPSDDGVAITARVERDGTVIDDPELAKRGVTAAYHVQLPGIDHQVASPFWDFMNSTGMVLQDGEHVTDLLFVNPFYATGYPITEAYWANVKVGGVYQDVLMQCFERRCLTYTPDNPTGWQVEAGNVGRHYYEWRYDVVPPDAASPDPE